MYHESLCDVNFLFFISLDIDINLNLFLTFIIFHHISFHIEVVFVVNSVQSTITVVHVILLKALVVLFICASSLLIELVVKASDHDRKDFERSVHI